MIRINLLPHRLAQQQVATLGLRRQALWVMCLTLGIGLFVAGGLWFTLAQQQRHNDRLRAQIQAQIPLAQATQTLIERITDLHARRHAWHAHMAQQAQPWRLLTQLQALMPNSLYLTQLSWQASLLSLEGQAGSHEAIALFVSQLNQARWLQQVTLASSQQQSGVWTFTLHAQTLLGSP